MPASLPLTFWRLWLTQTVSQLGSQAALFALGLWLFRQTGQVADYALVAIAVQLPRLLGLLLGRRRFDRLSPARLLVQGNLLAAAASLGLGLLVLNGQRSPGLVLVGVLLSSAAAAWIQPAYFLAVERTVLPEQRLGANAWAGSGEAIAQIGAPSLAGLVLAAADLPGVIAVDALSFGIALLGLVRQPQLRRIARMTAATEAPQALRLLLVGLERRRLLGWAIASSFTIGITEILFPLWILRRASALEMGLVISLGGLGWALGSLDPQRIPWRSPQQALQVALLLQALILLGALMPWSQQYLVLPALGCLGFSALCPLLFGSLRTALLKTAVPQEAGRLLAGFSFVEVASRLAAFVMVLGFMPHQSEGVHADILAVGLALAGTGLLLVLGLLRVLWVWTVQE